MRGSCTTLYVRHRFQVTDPEAWVGLTLLVEANDGFVAYLNAAEAYRSRAGITGESVPAGAAARENLRDSPRMIPLDAGLLVRGENVLAIQGVMASVDSPDYFLAAGLAAEARPDPARDAEILEELRRSATPADAVTLVYLEGRVLQRQGKHPEAVERFREALRMETDDPLTPLARLVESLRASGRAAEADRLLREHFERAEAPPDEARALRGAAWSLLRFPGRKLEDYLRACIWAKRARELEPLNPLGLNRLGVAWYRAGLYDDAIAALRTAEPLNALADPQSPKSYAGDVAFLAMSYQRLGRTEEAREALAKLRDPERTAPWTNAHYVLEAERLLRSSP
jgi:tetratricopeptide (TPR) repeat protein